jgi:Raf kinase inhibitor-like YbhB/YbcL family protein
MSRPVKVIIFIVVILISFVMYLLQRNSGKLTDELVYHNALQRSIILKSDAFENDSTIPLEYTGKGANISPRLSWDNIPEGTKSLAIIVTDYDAPSPKFQLFTVGHWVLYNIPLGVIDLEKGISAEKLKSLHISVGKNIAGKHEYTGPRPPFGTHLYYFRIYALNFKTVFMTNDNRDELIHAMKGQVLGYGELIGKF